jgi:lipopolysaccharide transport system ATP-binding protein
MACAIVVENLSKQYRIGQLHRKTTFREALVQLVKHPLRPQQTETIWALRDISFRIEEGEVVGIIGRNGAGKSTLLKVLSKITYSTSGKVKVRGRIASLLEVGTGFHEELTGRENIYLNGSILGMQKKEIDAKLDAIVTFAGVEKFLDTPIKRYSSGMRLRLGFAVAAHLEPDILLVDEVLAVGDAEFQKKCLRAMDDLRNSGRTVLFVSHNMAAIENLCPRALWVDNGQIRQDGEAREVIKAYLSAFAGVQQAVFDLGRITTRGGAGGIRYTRLEFLSADKQPQKLIRSGDSLVAKLYFHAERRIPNPHFGLELYTELGTLITSINTWNAGFDIPFVSPGSGYIELEVDFLNLIPARYYVSLWAADVGMKYDRVDHCATLDIEVSDCYQSGRGIDSRFGIVFLPCKWRFNGSSEGKQPNKHYVATSAEQEE